MNIRFENQKRSKIVGAARGFTLVETLVAIAIFAFAITGLISITAKGVFNTNFVKNKFTAGYLALEGAELARNIRDSAALSNVTWTSMMSDPQYLGGCSGVGNACVIDGSSVDTIPQPVPCPTPDECPFMNYRESTAMFNYEGLDPSDNRRSIFRRIIMVEEITSGTEARVVSRVEWMQGDETHAVEFVYDMLRWVGQ